MKAIMELRAIFEQAKYSPGLGANLIDEWIQRHLRVHRVKLNIEKKFYNKEHANRELQSAFEQLAKEVSLHQLPYPVWKDNDEFKTCELQVLSFRDEFGR